MPLLAELKSLLPEQIHVRARQGQSKISCENLSKNRACCAKIVNIVISFWKKCLYNQEKMKYSYVFLQQNGMTARLSSAKKIAKKI